MDPTVALPGYAPSFSRKAEEAPTVPWYDAFAAGFRLENDVANAWELMSEPIFKPEEGYDNAATLQNMGLWDDRDAFLGVQSRTELAYRKSKLDTERQLRKDYLMGGWAGFWGAVAGGVISPTMFLPIVGPAKTAGQAFKSALILGTAGGLAQEIPLQMNQYDRTAFESTASVAGQAVLGGILGPLASRMSRKQMERAVEDMANGHGKVAISPLGKDVNLATRVSDEPPIPPKHVRLYQAEGDDIRWTQDRRLSSVGKKEFYVDVPEDVVSSLAKGGRNAAEVILPEQFEALRKEVGELAQEGDSLPKSAGAASEFEPTGGVKQTWLTRATGVGKASDYISPVVRVIDQPGVKDKFLTLRWMMQQLSNAGLRMEDNVLHADGSGGRAVAKGGTIENLRQQHYGKLFKGREQVDKAFMDYVFEAEPQPKIAPMVRAGFRARTRGKMSRVEFNQEVGRAMRAEDKHPNPHVQRAAEAWRKEVLNPMLKEAQDVGLYDEVIKVVGDPSYLMRVFDPILVRARMGQLVEVLGKHYAQLLENDFFKAMERYKAKKAGLELVQGYAERPLEEVAALRKKFLDDLKDAEEKRSPDVVTMEGRLSGLKERYMELRKERRETRDQGNALEGHPLDARIEQLKKEIKDLEEVMPQEYTAYKAMERETRRQLNALNKSVALRANRQAGKLSRIERIEEMNFNALKRLQSKGEKLLRELDEISDEKLDAELSKLKTAFAQTGKTFDAGEERVLKLSEGPDDQLLFSELDRQAMRSDKLSYLAERIQLAEDYDRAYVRQLLEESNDAVLRKAQGLIERRGVRASRYREEAAKLSPEQTRANLAAEAANFRSFRDKLIDDWRTRGLDDVVGALDGEAPDFAAVAKERAQEVAEAMGNMTERLPVHDLIVGKHGPERARVLTIASKDIEFVLENDADKVVSIYMRTLAPDIEMARRFGDVAGSQWFVKAADEYRAKLDAITSAVDKDGKPRPKDWVEKESLKLAKQYEELRHVTHAMIDRIRHLRGIPENPDGFGYRAGRLVMNLNVLRYMGMVTISSVADVANLVLKHGLTRTYRDVFVPLVTNLQQFKLTAREAFLSGEALDVMIHSRAQAGFDVGEHLAHGSAVERGIEYMTNRMGIIAAFDYWTKWMKQLATVGSTAHMMDDMKLLMEGGASAKEVARATEYLASLNLDAPAIERIWKQVVDTNGGNKVNGVWWPNTENWADKEAQRLYRQAITGELSSTIVTPGLERPLWMDRNIGFRMVGQFRSFMFSSLTKNLQAGLQAPDMALINGTLISLAMGALSYYLWALSAGGDALEQAMSGDIGKWADEAIARSGRLSIGQDVWEMGQRLPWVRDYATFSGGRNAQRQGQDFLELFTGPSYDFASKAAYVVLNSDQPNASTLHAARQMIPYQNTIGIRNALNQVERSAVDYFDLPERRQ